MDHKNNKMEKAARALLCMQRHSWEQGMAMQAFLEWDKMDVVAALAHEAVYRRMEDGRAAMIGFMDAVTDPCCVGEALLRACEVTKDEKLMEGCEALLNWALKKAPRNEKGVLYHLTTNKQFWADSMYMLPSFLIAAGHVEVALSNFYGYWEVLFDRESKLMHHMWDDEKKIYVRDAHWGTGNGWTLAAMARIIALLPAEYEADREKISEVAQVLLDSLLEFMRPDGFFHDVVDDPDTFVETNLSQMTAYAIYRGVKDGWLDDKYRQKADFMRAAAESMQDEFGFIQNVCGAPAFDKPGISPEGQAFFLLMENAACSDALGRRS